MIAGAFVLGAGRAGRGLARALRASGVNVLALHGRHTEARPDHISSGRLPRGLLGADVVMVAVRDTQIDAAFDEVLEAGVREDAVLLHLSGSAEPSRTSMLGARGISYGTFHPLLPLARPERAASLFRGGWVGIDGDARARAVGAELAAALGSRTLFIPAGARALYHAAAVIASNLTVVLAGEAERVMRETGIDAEAARGAVGTLFAAAAANVMADGAAALTGPLARGEAETVRRHLLALRGFPAARRAYLAVSLAAAPPGSELARMLEQAADEPVAAAD